MFLKNILIVLFLFLFVSCSGPTGPSGYDGIDGDGIIITKFINIKPSQWIKQNGTYNIWYTKIPIPEITNEVVNQGYVLVYVGASDITVNSWLSLPYTQYYQNDNQNYSSSYYFWHQEGFVELQFQTTNSIPLPPNFADDFKISIVRK